MFIYRKSFVKKICNDGEIDFTGNQFQQIVYKRMWNILFHVKVMAFNNSYRLAKLYWFSNIY